MTSLSLAYSPEVTFGFTAKAARREGDAHLLRGYARALLERHLVFGASAKMLAEPDS